jgi:hypothetical protein
MLPGKTCNRCKGKGRIYAGGGRMRSCPDCENPNRTEYKRAEAMNALAHCWARYEKGETEEFNLSLAVNGCIRAGYSLEELATKRHIPMRTLRKLAAGQGILSAE